MLSGSQGVARARAVRGATTIVHDDSTSIAEGVAELLRALCAINDLAPSDIVSAIFSATPDLSSLYPAAVARTLGWDEVPMLCVAEMAVPGSPSRCVRVLLHVVVEGARTLRPVYLREARVLRPDLVAREPA